MTRKDDIKAQIGAALIALDIVEKTGSVRQLQIARELITDARDSVDLII